MKTVTVDKQRLLEILKANKETYLAELVEARKEYTQSTRELLEQALASLTAFKDVTIMQTAPIDQSYEYDRAISMLELSVDDTVTLDQREFDNYVHNKWQFVQHLSALRTTYANNK